MNSINIYYYVGWVYKYIVATVQVQVAFIFMK